MLSTKNFLEDCILEWGYKAAEINKAYRESMYEAKYLSLEANIEFIKETMSVILERDNKKFIDKFMESKNYDLKLFIESLYDEDVISTDFSPDQRPENAGHKYYTKGIDDVVSDENQDENNKEADK